MSFGQVGHFFADLAGNLCRWKQFYSTWPAPVQNSTQPVRKLSEIPRKAPKYPDRPGLYSSFFTRENILLYICLTRGRFWWSIPYSSFFTCENILYGMYLNGRSIQVPVAIMVLVWLNASKLSRPW